MMMGMKSSAVVGEDVQDKLREMSYEDYYIGRGLIPFANIFKGISFFDIAYCMLYKCKL